MYLSVACMLLCAVALSANMWLINQHGVKWIQGEGFGYGLLLEILGGVSLVSAAIFGFCWLVGSLSGR